MSQAALSLAEVERTLRAIEEAKRVGFQGYIGRAARLLGMPAKTLSNRIHGGSLERGAAAAKSAAEAVADPQAYRREVKDASYWKREAIALRNDLARSEHLLAEASGLASRPLQPPEWVAAAKSDAANRAVGLLHLSDVHAGEVIRADEIANLNSYDLDVCRRRLRRLFDTTVDVLPRMGADCRLQGVVVALNGDMVSGGIHEELRESNALTSTEQVWFVMDELAAGLRRLADTFGTVWVVCTPGNHGRLTERTHAKRTAALSYDTMIGEALRRHFAEDPRFTFHVSPSRDAIYPIFSWTVFQSHGDALGTGGGKGFAGALLPVLRGSKQVEWQAAQARREYDIILTGHYHTSGSLGKTLANGSVVGYSEYANSIRASVEPPQQWLVLVHEKWAVRERLSVRLEDPVVPELPRVRVPAVMQKTE